MLTSKKRAELRTAAQTEKAIIHIGKNGVTAETEIEAQNAFNNREIVKGRVLETSPVSAGEAAIALSIASASEVIQVVGNVFTLYKKLPPKPKPKPKTPAKPPVKSKNKNTFIKRKKADEKRSNNRPKR
jgi:RNA-binding protein